MKCELKNDGLNLRINNGNPDIYPNTQGMIILHKIRMKRCSAEHLLCYDNTYKSVIIVRTAEWRKSHEKGDTDRI